MERKEAVVVLQESKRQNEIMRDNPSTFFTSKTMAGGVGSAKKRIAALDMAIAALSQTNEPLTCEGCACEKYSRDAYPCNSCSRNNETISDQYRPPEGEEERHGD